jgi:hypothetical protein
MPLRPPPQPLYDVVGGVLDREIHGHGSVLAPGRIMT